MWGTTKTRIQFNSSILIYIGRLTELNSLDETLHVALNSAPFALATLGEPRIAIPIAAVVILAAVGPVITGGRVIQNAEYVPLSESFVARTQLLLIFSDKPDD